MRNVTRWLGTWLMASCLSMGCGDSKQKAAPAPQVNSEPAVKAPAEKPTELEESAVKALIDAWLAAQNSGNFSAYQALYAQKMDGVKRAGFRTSRFDRKHWMADRERMFKHPMSVSASEIVVRAGKTAATVDLRQSFTQRTFHDEGPKRMVVIREGNELRIAREEMLSSQLSAVAGQSLGNPALHLVIEIADQPYVVLGDGDDSSARGAARLVDKPGDPYLAMREVNPASAAAANWKDRKLSFYNADGSQCEATLGPLMLVAGSTPHFGEVQRWNEDPDMPGGKWSKAQIARVIYRSSSPYLVAALSSASPCHPVFGLERGRALVFAEEKPNAELTARAVAAFRALPGYATIQKDFTDNYEGKGEWAPEPKVTRFAKGEHGFVAVVASEGNGCGDFEGSLWVLLQEEAGGGLKPISNLDSGVYTPSTVFDSDGDGRIEVIADDFGWGRYQTYLAPAQDGFADAFQIEFPFNDCGC